MSQDAAVIEKLIKRAKGEKDNYKIGLFLPGGGMQGVFSGGVVTALKELGVSDHFDFIYGFSSGAFSGAYMLSGNPKVGTTVYYDDLTNRRFIQPWKLKNSMNLDYFCEEVVRNRKKLNFQKIKNSKALFKVFVTNPQTCKREFFTNRDDIDIVKALRASCAYPGFCSSGLTENGVQLVDGNALELIPIQEAIKDGCTDVLVVSNLPKDYRASRFNLIHIISSILLRNFPKEFRIKYKERIKKYNHSLDIIFGRKVFKQINIFTISPEYKISAGYDKREKLRNFAEHGVKRTLEAFGYEATKKSKDLVY